MSDSECELSDKGTLKELNKFKLSGANLPYKKCQNFPKIIKCFVKTVGIKNLINVAETVPSSVGADHAGAINTAYVPYEVFKYKGSNYYIRFTLISTDGTVVYDSSTGTTDADASAMQLHTTRMEFQRATEEKWGSELRISKTVNTLQEYAAIWIPGLILPLYPNYPVNVKTVYGFRFSVQINSETGKYQPLLTPV